ncbi:MAG: hypothetical protein WAU77_12235 [Solirubrobacteraceae bacterium]
MRSVEMAWKDLPSEHRLLLEEVGASQWTIVEESLGSPVHKLLRSAGHRGLSEQSRLQTDAALAVWVPDLRIVVFNARHPALAGLSPRAASQFLTRTAWHEWGHALSVARCTKEDITAGPRLLKLAPTAVSNTIRDAGYRPHEYTHELVAEIYSLLITRSQRKESGRPRWLNQEVYDLVKRVTGWTE